MNFPFENSISQIESVFDAVISLERFPAFWSKLFWKELEDSVEIPFRLSALD